MSYTSALLEALSLPNSLATSLKPISGGSNFAKTLQLTVTSENGTMQQYFVKTSSSPGAEVMFTGEHASLNAIADAVPDLCPRSLATGRLNSGREYYLITEYIDFSASSSDTASGSSLAAKLARLHSTPVPIPEGYKKPMFGFPVTTCCGDTPQDNSFKQSWAEFFAENRLLGILARSEKQNGKDAGLRKSIEAVADQVVPRLLGDGHLGGKNGITPVVVHGDLWSGNRGRGRIGGREESTEIVFDPSASYAHSEFELGIMKMFGGFGKVFLEEYHALVPKNDPVEEYDDRVRLYELYHHLNHYSIFGGGYRSGAMSIMNDLIKKYGESV